MHSEDIGPCRIYLADCMDVLLSLADNSLDAIVTDPPYGLKFMGKKWDHGVPSVEIWREHLRVLKPGGHLLAFAGTRKQHRMACNIEDAGFEIRDMIAWIYGSGFPKSHNLEGKHEGWGTAIKPALEPITFARKPLVGTVAQNMEKHGVGALNIDGCRVGDDARTYDLTMVSGGFETTGGGRNVKSGEKTVVGRWPANVIHDGSEEVVKLFPWSESGAMSKDTKRAAQGGPGSVCYGTYGGNITGNEIEASSGSAARFFYCPKADRTDRNEGCDGLAKKPLNCSSGTQNPGSFQAEGTDRTSANHHPTVKPTDLMQYLIRLVTPAGGLVGDFFMGSGTTGKAAVFEDVRFIGCDKEAEYFEIAKARIQWAVSNKPHKQLALL